MNLTKGVWRIEAGWWEQYDGQAWCRVARFDPVRPKPVPWDAIPVSVHFGDDGASQGASADAFGNAIRAAQALPERDPVKTFIPDRFANNPDFDTSKAYDAVMRGA